MEKATPNDMPMGTNDIFFIREKFSQLFAQTMNVLELAISDTQKLDKTKALIAGQQSQAEHDILIKVQDKLK